MGESVDANGHIRQYLKDYLTLTQAPGFAVMVRGPWGIGKTFLIKRVMAELLGGPQKYTYVSLYGVSSTSEMENLVFSALHPRITSKGARAFGALVKSGLQAFDVDLEIDLKDYIRRATQTVYVFDDVERSKLDADSVFGYLNQFVEHDGCRVIVIANEAEMEQTPGYRAKREKLIGQTLEASSSTSEAFSAFIASIRDQAARGVLCNLQDELLALYEHAQVLNLRVLKQTMWDFERTYNALSDRHRASELAVRQLALELFALSFEVKLGRLNVSNLRGRMQDWVISSMKPGEVRLIKISDERYPTVSLVDTILGDETLVNLLGNGLIDKEQIRSDLDASRWFVTDGGESAWRTVWHLISREDDAVNAAIVEMKAKLRRLEYHHPGEILHVFGLLLMLSKNKLIRQSPASVLRSGKAYIQRLQRREMLPALSSDIISDNVHHGSWSGLGFYEKDSDEFRELASFLRNRQQTARDASLPEQGQQLLIAIGDLSLFTRRLVGIGGDGSDLIDGPVLAFIPPTKFAHAWLSQPARAQQEILSVLSARYSSGSFGRGLEIEREWLSSLVRIVRARAKDAGAIRRYKLKIFADVLAEKLGEGEDVDS